MGTRSGDVDPAVLEYIMDNTGMDIRQMLNCLNKKSGFAGLSCSSDMRDVRPPPKGRRAGEGGAGRLDLPHPEVHQRIQCGGGRRGCDRLHGGHRRGRLQSLRHVINSLSFMGVKIDPAKNKRGTVGIISTDDSTIKVLRIPDQRGAADRARHAGDRLQAVSGKIC